MKKIILAATILITNILSIQISHGAVFNLNLVIGGQKQTASFDKAEDLIDAIKTDKIKSMFPAYTETEAVDISMDFRGLPLSLSYAASGTTLILNIPSIGVTQTFTGTDRDATNSAFKNWMKSDGGATLNAIMKKLAEVSPSDPVAGNPNALMNKMAANDFDNALSKSTTRDGINAADNMLGIEARLGSFSQAGENGKSLTVPISYTIPSKSNPQRQLSFFMPLTYVQVGKSKSYSASIGSGYRFPLTDSWALTPTIGTGVVGSLDLGSVGRIVSGSLTSTKNWGLPKGTLSLANMLGYYKTLEVKIGKYRINPDITNTVFRNGIMYSLPHAFFGGKAESEFYLLDTRFFGSALYMDQYNELGYSIGTDKKSEGIKKYLRLGGSYLFSNKTKGFSVNLGYSF